MSPIQSVLLVEDEVLIRQILHRFLARTIPDAHVTVAASVDEARRALASVLFTCVVSDYHLPDGTGISVLQLARLVTPTIPVLIMSGNPSIERHVVAAGASAFLPKPLDLSLFLATFDRVC